MKPFIDVSARIVPLSIFLIVFTSAQHARAVLIAAWRFEPGPGFLLDSSGNNRHLSNVDVDSSLETPGAFSGGSAEFDGNDILQTLSQLDLTSYYKVTLSWWQFVDNGKVAIVFEHSADTNSNIGGFELAVNEVSTNGTSSGTGRPVLCTINNYNGDDQARAIGSWRQFTMAIDLTQTANPNLIVEVTNGSEGPFQGADVGQFRNDFFYIGSRFSNVAGLGFIGNIDEFRIEAVPEPTSCLLAALGLVYLASYVRCGRRRSVSEVRP